MGVQPTHSPKLVEEIRQREYTAKLDQRTFPIRDPATIPAEEWKNDAIALSTVPLIDRQSILKYYSHEPFASSTAPSDSLNFNK